ncbi:MAG: pseudouridine synthase [Pseudomonadota bacterium]
MHSKRTRLDRFISQHTGINSKDVRLLIAQGRLKIDGYPASEIHQFVDEFTQVILDEKVLQAKKPVYIMMNKPIGVVSATKDGKHTTVLDVLKKSLDEKEILRLDIDNLHIVGRLDFNTSGLLLLTNDGRWSRRLTTPEHKISKLYKVTLANPIDESYIHAFAAGMHFPFENITTRPATLQIISEHVAMVTLVEGRYHQIKRMFGRFQNPVIKLHRVTIGTLTLDERDEKMQQGCWRELTNEEVVALAK